MPAPGQTDPANRLAPPQGGGGDAAAPRPTPGPAAGRDLRIDTLRGIMLVAIALNHLNTELRLLTDYSLGFASTAEGFVFLSGLVAGLVYTRRSMRVTGQELTHKARHRAWQIYLAHMAGFVGALIGLQLLTHFAHADTNMGPELFFKKPATALLLGATLLYQPGLLDILPMYCAFMLALPFILAALRKGYTGRLFGLSAALWLLSQLRVLDHVERWLQTFLPINLGVFDVLAWQLLFVAGVFFGFQRAKSTEPLFSFRPAMLAICLLVAVPLWFVLKYHHAPAGLSMDVIWSWADKKHLAPLRLLDFAVLAYLIAAVGAHRPAFVTFRPLAFLGRNSLIVFTTQATLCVFIVTQPQLSATFAERTTTAVAMVALLFPVAWVSEKMAKRQRRDSEAGPSALSPQ